MASRIPKDHLNHVLSYCDDKSLARSMRVYKYWRDQIKNEKNWPAILSRNIVMKVHTTSQTYLSWRGDDFYLTICLSSPFKILRQFFNVAEVYYRIPAHYLMKPDGNLKTEVKIIIKQRVLTLVLSESQGCQSKKTVSFAQAFNELLLLRCEECRELNDQEKQQIKEKALHNKEPLQLPDIKYV